MQIQDVENLVNDLISQGMSVDQIIDELAKKKCYHTLVEMVLLKKKISDGKEIQIKLASHEFFSKQREVQNPFTEDFIKILKGDDEGKL